MRGAFGLRAELPEVMLKRCRVEDSRLFAARAPQHEGERDYCYARAQLQYDADDGEDSCYLHDVGDGTDVAGHTAYLLYGILQSCAWCYSRGGVPLNGIALKPNYNMRTAKNQCNIRSIGKLRRRAEQWPVIPVRIPDAPFARRAMQRATRRTLPRLIPPESPPPPRTRARGYPSRRRRASLSAPRRMRSGLPAARRCA